MWPFRLFRRDAPIAPALGQPAPAEDAPVAQPVEAPVPAEAVPVPAVVQQVQVAEPINDVLEHQMEYWTFEQQIAEENRLERERANEWWERDDMRKADRFSKQLRVHHSILEQREREAARRAERAAEEAAAKAEKDAFRHPKGPPPSGPAAPL